MPLLTDPGGHGGDPTDAFDVVVPRCPATSSPTSPHRPADPASDRRHPGPAHDRGARLGALRRLWGDIGADVTNWLAIRSPDRVLGIHLIHPKLPTTIDPDQPLSAAEPAYLDRRQVQDHTDGGDSAIQATRPDTLAAAPTDSPAGLAAWILDKYRAWSDCHGDLERRFSRDELLTLTVEDVGYPRELADRSYHDIRHWRDPTVGGHFLPLEKPDLLASELRAFFRGLRHR